MTNATGVANGSFTLFNNDPLLAGMVAGSSGAISYTTIFPIVKQMYSAYAKGQMTLSRSLERQILKYNALIHEYGSKSAARNLPYLVNNKIDLGPPRPPLEPQTTEDLNGFKEALINAGFLTKSEL